MKCFFLFAFLLLFVSFSSAQNLPRSPFVGAEIGTLTSAVQRAYRFEVEKGLIIYKVFPESPAQKARLEAKDVIISIDSFRIKSVITFQHYLRSKKAGDTLDIWYVRDDTVRQTALVLGFLPREHNFFFETVYSQIELDSNLLLRTILTLPKYKPIHRNKISPVILISDIGNRSIESLRAEKTMLYQWVDSLTKNGFATLRIEREGKGIGDSEGNFDNWTVEKEQKSIILAAKSFRRYGVKTDSLPLITLGAASGLLSEDFVEGIKEYAGNDIRILAIPIPKESSWNATKLYYHFPDTRYLKDVYFDTYLQNLSEKKDELLIWLNEKHKITQALKLLQY